MEITIKVDGVTLTVNLNAPAKQRGTPAEAQTRAIAQVPNVATPNPLLTRKPFMTAELLMEREEAEWRERQRREGGE